MKLPILDQMVDVVKKHPSETLTITDLIKALPKVKYNTIMTYMSRELQEMGFLKKTPLKRERKVVYEIRKPGHPDKPKIKKLDKSVVGDKDLAKQIRGCASVWNSLMYEAIKREWEVRLSVNHEHHTTGEGYSVSIISVSHIKKHL
jgi:hypothetical protein